MSFLRRSALWPVVAALVVASACSSPPQAGTSPGGAAKPAAQAGSAPTAAAVAPTAAPPTAIHVRFATQNSASDAAAYVAYERGFFKQEGIDFEFVSFSNASEMIPSFKSLLACAICSAAEVPATVRI